MNIVTYLINLDGSHTRLTQASEQLHQQHISFIRVPAFDGRQLDTSTVAEYDEDRALSYMGRKLKGGELGCYFSHLDCAQRFLRSHADYAIVLEDDMQLADGVMPTISKALEWLENNRNDWHLLHIGANKRKLYSVLTSVGARELLHAHYFPMTTTGLVWSRAGAQTFLDQHHKIFAPVDNYFRWWLTRSNKGYSIWPPLVTTTGAESDIDTQNARRKVAGRSKLYGVIKQARLWEDKARALKHKWCKR